MSAILLSPFTSVTLLLASSHTHSFYGLFDWLISLVGKFGWLVSLVGQFVGWLAGWFFCFFFFFVVVVAFGLLLLDFVLFSLSPVLLVRLAQTHLSSNCYLLYTASR